MIIDRNENTTLITQESISLSTFRERFRESYEKFKNDNIIVNLLAFTGIAAADLMELHELAMDHLKSGKSFVIVNDSVNYDDVNNDLVVVPTVKEAYDLIEMDEITRDLDA